MNYELAKQLKDAGFPQAGEGKLYETDEGRMQREEMGPIDSLGTYLTQVVYFPTLSELIEACDKSPRQFSLYGRHKERWEASSVGITQPFSAMIDGTITQYGSTPEEAVARLWLELNKK